MSDAEAKGPKAIGGDLVIPLLAIGFAVNFFVDITDLAWEARANGTVIGAIMLVLIAILFMRMGLALSRGQATLAVSRKLTHPFDVTRQRLGLVGLVIAFLLLLPTLGVTLGLMLFLGCAMPLLRADRPKVVLAVAVGLPLVVYLAFFVLLRSRLPQGPVEWALGNLLGLGG